MNEYKYDYNHLDKEYDYLVGHGLDDYFIPIKGFKHWDESFMFYMSNYMLDSKLLTIKDNVHKEFFWLEPKTKEFDK